MLVKMESVKIIQIILILWYESYPLLWYDDLKFQNKSVIVILLWGVSTFYMKEWVRNELTNSWS